MTPEGKKPKPRRFNFPPCDEVMNHVALEQAEREAKGLPHTKRIICNEWMLQVGRALHGPAKIKPVKGSEQRRKVAREFLLPLLNGFYDKTTCHKENKLKLFVDFERGPNELIRRGFDLAKG